MRKFLQSAAFLAISGIIAKAVGALFKVPLTNILGAEGMGIYQLVFPVYTVLLALSSGGLPQAISRMVSRCEAAGGAVAVRRVFIVCLFALTVIGAIGSVLMLVSGSAIAFIQGNSAAAPAYWALSPSVLFVSVMSVLRGYFQGKRNMFPTAVSQLAEQVIKLVAGLSVAALLLNFGLVSGVTGALIGVSISEAAALGITGVMYLAHRRKEKVKTEAAQLKAPTNKEILKEIYVTAVPIALSSLIMPMSQLIDSVMVVNLLKAAGQTTSGATTLYGIVTAPISTLINLPTVLAAALAVSIIPNLAGGDVKKITGSYIRLASVCGAAGAAVLLVFGDELLYLLYGGLPEQQLALAAGLMRIMSVSVYFISMAQVMAAAMQAEGKAKLPAVNLLIGAAVKVGLTAALVLTVGITGSVIATVVCYAVTYALDAVSLKKVTGSYYVKQTVIPLICAFVAGGAAYAAKSLTSGWNMWLALAFAGFIFMLLFFVCAFLTKSVRRADLLRK